MLVFRQGSEGGRQDQQELQPASSLFDPTSSTYTYLLGDSRSGEAAIIDPLFEQARRDAALVSDLELTLAWTLETHIPQRSCALV